MNKGIFAMSAIRKIGFGIVVLALLACEQPFKAGLGRVQDYQPPMVVLEAPGANDCILGTTTFRGYATDDYRVRRVDIRVTNYEYLLTGERNGLYQYTSVNLADDGKWNMNIDTTKFPDGDFRIQLRAFDDENKKAETKEIRFIVKNTPPSISIEPLVVTGDDDGNLGGRHLNWDNAYTLPSSFKRELDASGAMVGMIADTIGINMGTNDRFAPQIRFWQVKHDSDKNIGTYYQDSGKQIYIWDPATEIPSENDVPWADVDRLLPLSVSTDIPGAYAKALFQYNLPQKSDRIFAFQVRAQSLDGPGTTFTYPRDYWTGDAWQVLSAEQKKENSMLMVYLRAPDEYPSATIWALGDITDPAKGTFDLATKDVVYENIQGLDPDGDYVYIDALTVVKKGPFTLRVKTSHSQGIESAWVYFEKTTDPDYRGRFIWDPADGQSLQNVADVDAVDYSRGMVPYSQWGFFDGNTRGSGSGQFPPMRSFIFTYRDDGTDTTNEARYSGLAGNMGNIPTDVKNRSKIQRYRGTNWADWNLRDGSDSKWEDIAELEDGDYIIYVYTRSYSGTRTLEPEKIQLTIDRDPPEIQLNRVVGGIEQDSCCEVDGVIKPRFFVSDARSGLRPARSTYFPAGGNEQRYILVHDNQKKQMEDYLATTPWPALPPGQTIPGVTIWKDGPIADASCCFIVSNIYTSQPGPGPRNPIMPTDEAGTLTDGTYWLYVFARDKAFNVGTRTFEFRVRAEADRPVIEFPGGTIDPRVANPNPGAANTFEEFGPDGKTVTRIRNRFGSASSIRVEFKDDDSLDLGTNPAAQQPPASGTAARSSVKVTFTGSLVDESGKIVARDGTDYVIELTDAEVKNAFGYQNITSAANTRLAVTRSSGIIEQRLLLDKLKANQNYNYLFGVVPGDTQADIERKKGAYSSLPDGMYEVSITVSDYAAEKAIKLVMNDATDPAARAISANEKFWIVVDTKKPQIDQSAVNYPSNTYIPIDEISVIGITVSDENGPITADLVSVVDGNGRDASNIVSKPISLNRTSNVGNPNLWEYGLTIPVNIRDTGRTSGTFTINVRFTDRFGVSTTLSQQYMADKDPPEVGLSREIETFERQGVTDAVNAARLTNKVISFTVSASDSGSAVAGIRWWLLPASQPPVASFDDYSGITDNGRRGDINMSASQFSVYVDTKDWDDGLYNLYIMAVDMAGNYSTPVNKVHQQIFLLQEEDRPYFQNIIPNSGVIGQTDLFVRGLIMDDDGFADGTVAADGSITIWFSNNTNANTNTENIQIDPTGAVGYMEKTVTSGLTLQGRNISLNLDLHALFPGKISTDGVKHFIIEARDSAANKFHPNGPPAISTDRVSRRKHFSFTYDTINPRIDIEAPITGKTFGPNAGISTDPEARFDIKGWFEDGNLEKNTSNQYYLKYELDSWSAQKVLDQNLPAGTTGSWVTSVTQLSTVTRVNFTIPASRVVDELLQFTGLPEGMHTLTLSVDDKSGKTGRISVSFIKDMTPPVFTFSNIDIERPLENPKDTPVIDWWAMPSTHTVQTWNEAKQNYLAAAPGVSTIYYDQGTTPVLTGAFEDSISSVDTASFRYWIDGDTSPRPGTVVGSGRNVRWSIPLTKSDGKPMDDGIHTIRISIADLPGNVSDSDMMFAFLLDHQRPSATIDMDGRRTIYGGGTNSFSKPGPNDTNAGAEEEPANRVFTVKGTAVDANIRDVRLRIYDAKGNQIHPVVTGTPPGYISPTYDRTYTSGNYPDITLEWKYGVDYDLYTQWADGSYDVVVVGIDRWGNESEEAVWTFTKDTAGPQIKFSPSLIKSTGNLPGPVGNIASINVLSTDDLAIHFSVIDDYSAIIDLQNRLDRWNFATGAWVEGTWEDICNPNDPDSPLGSLNVQWGIPVSTKGSLAEGLYRIRVKARDASYIRNGNGGNPVDSQEGYVYFFYDRSSPSIAFGVDNFISSRNRGGNLVVPVTVSDPNRIKTITAHLFKLDNTETGRSASFDYSASDTWPTERLENVSIPVGYDASQPNYLADGYYRLKVTATDWVGKSNTVTMNFTLDNTRPAGTISSPMPLHVPGVTLPPYLQEASEILLGGENSEIRGTSRDIGNGSESGVDAIWYYLGFPGNNPSAQTIITSDQIAQTVLGGTATANGDTGQNNAAFDNAAAAKTTTAAGYSGAWFKLDPDETKYEPPPGFEITANVYDWVMSIPNIYKNKTTGGLKPYGGEVTIKGQTYNTGNRRLSVPVEFSNLENMVRMPLFLRIADRVGNISYVRRDIVFNPDGDIPTTTILNPRVSTGSESEGRRAGAISVDGLAKNNWSVQSVVFRVLADDNPNSTPVNPHNAPINVITNSSKMKQLKYGYGEGREELDLIEKRPPANYDRAGWYFADLEALGSPEAPWSFVINSEQEITKKIPDLGFASTAGGPKDTIRVWIQIYVFRGNGVAERMSIGNPLEGGSITSPIPYARFFYLRESAPTIDPEDLWIGTSVSAGTAPADLRKYETGGGEVRSGKFAIRATLDAAAKQHLTEVQIRRVSESTPMPWTTAWKNTTDVAWGGSQYNPAVPGIALRTKAGGVFSGGQDCYLYYYFDSSYTTTTPPPGYSAVNNNAWRNTGGRFTVEVRIRDNLTPPGEATYTFDIGVDNFPPVADPRLETPKRVAGSNVDFMGRVFDYSTAMISADPNAPTAFTGNSSNANFPHGRVYAWFTKGSAGTFVNLDSGRLGQVVTEVPVGFMTNVWKDIEVTMNPATGDSINTITVNTTNAVSATINYPATSNGVNTDFAVDGGWVREISEFTARAGTKMIWDSKKDRDVTWMFTIDTTVLPDGLITLNYIVMDRAGNSTFYQQKDIFVRNSYPQIDRVTLYTDNNGVGAVYTTHDASNIASAEYNLDAYRDQIFTSLDADDSATINESLAKSRGYLNSGFISKNQFVGFGVETSLGNPNLHYRLQHVKRELVQLTGDNLQAMITEKKNENKNWLNLYTIAWNGGFGATRWREVFGVPTATPQIGTHFVLQLDAVPEDFVTTNAWVWRYRPIVSRVDVTRGRENGNNLPVRPNDINPPSGADAGDGFNFNGSQHFSATAANRINEFPATSPDTTAFFLIRAWDSVNPGGGENDQLYDAVVIGMSVFLSDKENPVARLYDLNPYTEEMVTGNNIGQSTDPLTGNRADNSWLTIRNALNPRGLGQNILRGGLYNVSTQRDLLVRSGHIEPRSGSNALRPRVRNADGTFTVRNADGFVTGDTENNTYANGTSIANDQVSGKVILRGDAVDNQLIREIRIYIGTEASIPSNHALYDPASVIGQSYAILRLDTNSQNSTYRTLQPVNGAQAWVSQGMHWKTGHTVEWAYVWDTEKRPNTSGTPANSVRIWVAVIDELGTPAALANSQVSESNPDTKNTFAVDIVPYVTGFERELPTYATRRSLQGWYSFFQGENNITALGYNLKGSSDTAMQLISTNGGSPLTLPLATGSQAQQTVNRIKFNVPGTAASGKIVLKVNGTTEALNHRSKQTQSWNRESFYSTPGSDLWINRPYAHIWRSLDASSAPSTRFQDSAALQSPGMVLEYQGTNSGRLHGTWAVYASAGWYYGKNDNAGRSNIQHSQNEPYANTDLSIYNGSGTLFGTAVHEQDGKPLVIVRSGLPGVTDGYISPNDADAAKVPTQRWQNSRIIGGSSVSHMTFYDSLNKSLWYGRGTNESGTRRIDGTVGSTPIVTGTANGIPASIGMSNNAGEYSAVEYVTNGTTSKGTGSTAVPVIAYYDQQNDTVRLAIAGVAAPGTGTAADNNWFRRYLLPETHPLRRGSGKYISMKVDKDNGIHLAFYNTTRSAIVYAYIKDVSVFKDVANPPTPSKTLDADTSFYVAVVDNVVKGGTWTDISVDNYGNPWIVYGDISRTGNTDGARIAYRSSANTGVRFGGGISDPRRTDTVTGADITGWEAVQMPSQYRVNDDRLNIEAWPPTVRGGTRGADPGWNAAVGYGSDMFRIAYFYYPAWKEY